MVDLQILEQMGSSQERLKQICTAAPPSPEESAHMTDEQRECRENDIKLRQKIQEDAIRRFTEHMSYSMRNYHMYSAVDLAWDAAPINKETYPLLLYAQGKLDLAQCASSLKGIPGADKYTTKDAKGNVNGINVPKFFETNFNLVRSVISRRLAAQANKYQALYPNFKYEARSTSTVGKCRADVLSQVMDIMSDQYDLRHHDVQVMRDAMLYGHSVDFIRSKWEREEQHVIDRSINEELLPEGKKKYKTVITKEGLCFVNPHPSRTFWDNVYPLSSINSDSGCEFIGFWDIARFGDVANNPSYWNRTSIAFSSSMALMFSGYQQYFAQYYCTITPPCDMATADLSGGNDRKNCVGMYSQDTLGSSIVLGNVFRKIVPRDYGIGDYPYPVWMRMIVASDQCILFAEFLPSTPACYCGINENDSRQLNISIAMELLPYQDQMTQLLSLLLLTIQSSNFRVLCVDVDTASPEEVARFRAKAQATDRYTTCTVFEYSGIKMKERGVDVKQIMTMVETQPSQAITVIFQAMVELVKLSERLMALSPQELGQPAPSGISATETNMIGATTETMYGFISDSIDEFRSAKKRMLYESYMICGSSSIRVPALNRYTRKVIEKAGFEVLDEDAETDVDLTKPAYHTIIGTKQNLYYDYIFTSRDGALRAVNTQSANVLTQLLNILQNPIVMQAMGKEKFYNIINEIFRLSGAGVDLNLELGEGESDQMGPDKQAQMEQVLQQLTQHVEQTAQQIGQIGQQSAELGQKFEELLKIVQELTQKVDEIDHKPPAEAPIDPLELAKTHQQLQIDSAEAAQRLAAGSQKMQHAQEKHEVDTGLKLLAPMAGAGP